MAKAPIDVRLYRSSVKGRRPNPADMSYGDLAINYNHEDPALIIKGDDNALIEFKPMAGVTVAATAPVVAKDGDLWWDTTSARLFLRYSSGTPLVSAWVDASPAAVPPSVANALTYKGRVDPTAAGSVPATPAVGDTWIASAAGTAAAGWTGLAGNAVSLHELMVWDGLAWAGAGTAASPRTAWQGAIDTTVARAAGYTPAAGDLLQVGKAGAPAADWPGVKAAAAVGDVYVFDGASWQQLGPDAVVADATSAAKGVVQLADAAAITAGTAGLVVDAAQLKAHVPPDATTAAKGVVQLADAAAITAGTAGLVVDAAQLKAAVPTQLLVLGWALGDEATAIKTGTAVISDHLPVAMKLKEVKFNAVKPPTGAAIAFGLRVNGTSVFATPPQIADGSRVSTAATLSTTALAADALIEVDFTQVGATFAGAGLKMYLIGERA
jgi:hypothetical protein